MFRWVMTDGLRIVLASGSPRRRDLLREAGWEFEVLPSAAEELAPGALPFRDLVRANAELKCRSVAEEHPAAIVIGADTLVAIDDEPLGKPGSLEEAAAMLARLAGRTHVVATGVSIQVAGRGVAVSFVEETRVTFKPLSGPEIDAYLALIDPLDKAGAYAAQEHGSRIIAGTRGSWTNIVGLPMERLEREWETLRHRIA